VRFFLKVKFISIGLANHKGESPRIRKNHSYTTVIYWYRICCLLPKIGIGVVLSTQCRQCLRWALWLELELFPETQSIKGKSTVVRSPQWKQLDFDPIGSYWISNEVSSVQMNGLKLSFFAWKWSPGIIRVIDCTWPMQSIIFYEGKTPIAPIAWKVDLLGRKIS